VPACRATQEMFDDPQTLRYCSLGRTHGATDLEHRLPA
jgi:hypothetical protein